MMTVRFLWLIAWLSLLTGYTTCLHGQTTEVGTRLAPDDFPSLRDTRPVTWSPERVGRGPVTIDTSTAAGTGVLPTPAERAWTSSASKAGDYHTQNVRSSSEGIATTGYSGHASSIPGHSGHCDDCCATECNGCESRCRGKCGGWRGCPLLKRGCHDHCRCAEPLGAAVDAAMELQIQNGRIARLVLYHYDFFNGPEQDHSRLNLAGQRKLQRLMRHFELLGAPLVIQETPDDPPLAVARKNYVIEYLSETLNTLVSEDQVVVRAVSPYGIRGPEAIEVYQNQLEVIRLRGDVFSGFGSDQGFSPTGPSGTLIGR